MKQLIIVIYGFRCHEPACRDLGPVFPQQTDDLVDELPVEKRHLSKLPDLMPD